MIRKLLVIATLGTLLSGCYMVPMALVGPVTSGYSTVSLIQSGVTTGANFMVKKSTGKTLAEHVMETLNKDISQQAYLPKEKEKEKLKQKYLPKNKFSAQCKKYDFYCKRMSQKKWLEYVNQNQSLLGSS